MTATRRRLVAAVFLGSGALAFATAGASAKQTVPTAEQMAWGTPFAGASKWRRSSTGWR